MIPNLRNYVLAGAGVIALVAMSAVVVQESRLQTERAAHADTRTQHAEQLQRLADASTKAAGAALRSQQRTAAALAAIDTSTTKGLTSDLRQNDNLRAADVDGTRRLRIAATCPARPADAPGLPSTAPGPSVDAGTVELAPEVRQAVFDTRAELVRVLRQLEFYQLREQQKAPDAP